MYLERILILFGLLVAVSPFIGLPLYVLAWVLPILGIVLAVIGFTLRLRRKDTHGADEFTKGADEPVQASFDPAPPIQRPPAPPIAFS